MIPPPKNDKATKVSVSFPESLKEAAERLAEKAHGGNFSAVVQDALEAHLRAAGALEPDPRAEVADAVEAALGEGLTGEEIAAAIRRAREIKAAA